MFYVQLESLIKVLMITLVVTFLTLFQNAFLSALPYGLMWMISVTGSLVVDFVRSRGYLTTIATRKISNTLGL